MARCSVYPTKECVWRSDKPRSCFLVEQIAFQFDTGLSMASLQRLSERSENLAAEENCPNLDETSLAMAIAARAKTVIVEP